MYYIGAADYHFWQGISKGQDLKGLGDLISHFANHPEEICAFDNSVTRDCVKAYNWGILMGLELSKEEYINLTEYKRPVIVVEDDIKTNTLAPITGNC